MSYQLQQNQNIDVVSEIKSRLDIVDVVSEHVILKKSGRNFWGLCPFHQEKTPSFSVNPDKGIYKCFGCGEGGDALSFLMKVTNSSFYEVITELAQKFGLPIPSFGGQSSESNELKKQIYEINAGAVQYFSKMLLESTEGQNAKEYLFNRNIDKDIIDRFYIGFASKQANGLINYLIENYKFSIDLMDKAGLVSKKTSGEGYVDRFRNRIIIPIQDEKGNFIAFGARALEDGQNPKYLNSPDSAVFNKSRSLYALYQAKDGIKTQDSAIVMEGYFDVISAHSHGLTNVVATLGTALTEQHVKMLARYMNFRRIYLAFDTDEAGISATSRGAEIIKSAFSGLGDIRQFDENFVSSTGMNDRTSCEIRIITTSSGKDPDEFIRNDGIEAYRKHINQAPLLIDYQINRIIKSKDMINSPQDKLNVTRELIPILSEIKNSIIRDEYIKLISERLGINEESLAIEVKKTQKPRRATERKLQPIVTKSLKKHVLAQKNLLSLYFINSDNVSILFVNDKLKEVDFTEPELILIKDEIGKIVPEVEEDVEKLTDELFTRLADNESAKQTLSDILFSLDDKKDLDNTRLNQYINDHIAYINLHLGLQEQEQLKNQYHSLNDDDTKALQVQYKVKELAQLNHNRLEIVND